MIIDTIIAFAIGLLNTLLYYLPTIDQEILDRINTFVVDFRQMLVDGSYFFPVNDLLYILGMVIAVEIAILGFKITRWIASNVSAGFLK
jgi:hypothetical protein